MKLIGLVCAAALCFSAAAYAQDPDADDGGAPPPGAAAGPGANGGRPGGRGPATGKIKACRETAQSKGLSGPDKGDSIAICMAEARLECVKKAVAEKARGPKRKEYVQNCMRS